METTGIPTRHWHRLDDGRVQCDVCPRACKIHEGQRGLCFVRGAENGEIRLYTYGRASGFCIDPVEKKPLNHFLPGSRILSFGTAGCNLACKFCQNWDISKARDMDLLGEQASPEAVIDTALAYDCRSVAFTYNDPVIFMEYAMDIADAGHERGVRAVAVTAGYMEEKPREEFYRHMDAANVDLKAFNEGFYHRLCGGSLAPVLETLKYLHDETRAWFEITTLLIPGENDGDEELHQECAWLREHLGPDVPLHFSAFHPDWKMRETPATPEQTLHRARRIAQDEGLHYVYTGNIHDRDGGTTFCARCENAVMTRDWYEISDYQVDDQGHCRYCGARIPGVFDGPLGHFGRHRLPVRIISSH